MVSLLTGAEGVGFLLPSELRAKALSRKVLCNSIPLKSGLLALCFSPRCLAVWSTMWRSHWWVSSLRETEQEEEKEGKAFSCEGRCPPKRRYNATQCTGLCGQGDAAVRRTGALHPKYATERGLKTPTHMSRGERGRGPVTHGDASGRISLILSKKKTLVTLTALP